jgi:hypothetical protein
MDEISDLLTQLARLQLEQSEVIEQLAKKTAELDTETQDESEIRVGDHVLLLTGGVRCVKGDRARVTKVTRSSVHFTVLRNQHSTYKQRRNVRKVQ